MRSYVCGQCHAEYYFEPESKKVVFPWDKGYLPEQMYAYYAGKPAGFEHDWQHRLIDMAHQATAAAERAAGVPF